MRPRTLRATAMTPAQQTILLDIAGEWAGIMADAFAVPRMAELRAHLASTYFAWSGPTEPGSGGVLPHPGPAGRD